MLRTLSTLFIITLGLFGYEDVSFSARTLGMGGDQAAILDDPFSHIANPALSARWRRPATALNSSLTGVFTASFTYVQPVKDMGVVGGSLFYRQTPGITAGDDLREADGRFFLAVPIGRFFSIGASAGTVSQEFFSESGGYPLPLRRFESGPILAMGTAVTFPSGINAGASVSDWWIGRSPLIQGGISWKNESTKADFLSSYLIAANIGFKDNVQKLHAGGEVFLLDEHLGLRAGFRYGGDSLSGFSPTLGLTLRTHRVEKTDFELHYGFLFTDAESSGSLHQFGLNVLFGDARKSEKDSIIAVQAERARKLKEQTLAREIEELRDELVKVAEERSALQEERADIERLREQALADLDRVKGVDVREDSTGIRITLLETSLRFEPGSAEIPFPDGFRTLDRTAGFLSHYPNADIQIKVHTDNSPVPEESQDKFPDNLSLSKARARQIKRYLVDVEGFSAAGVYAEGIGDAEPAQNNETPEGQAANRRVEILVAK